jgi:fibronectin type 3 domain-containing protein
LVLRFLSALGAVLLLSSCGYIGDPLPPLANIPTRVSDLAAIQQGGQIVARFTVPERTTEGFPIPRPLTLDLRIGTADQFEENDWASRAKHIPAPDITGPQATYEIPAAEWTGKDAVLAVRVTAANGKQSGWSNFVVVQVVAAVATPESVTPVATSQGVRLTWRAAGTSFRVLRKTEGAEYAAVAETTSPEWMDTAAEFGKRYSYRVQNVVKVADRLAESDLSKEASITPVDKFPPAVPAGVRADAAPVSIELTWQRNTEPDLSGYRIYRSVGKGAFEKIADVPAAPSYSDRAVEHGKSYRYAVTSVDRTGNESERSATVETVW